VVVSGLINSPILRMLGQDNVVENIYQEGSLFFLNVKDNEIIHLLSKRVADP